MRLDWKKVLWLLGLACALGQIDQTFAQQAKAENASKLGGVMSVYLGTQVIIRNSDTASQAAASTPLAGVGFFYERIANSFFGYEVRAGLISSPYYLTVDGVSTQIDNQTTYLGGVFRAYTTSHKRTGDNYYLAVGANVYSVNLNVKAGPDQLAGQKYSFPVYVYTLEGGMDYILKFAGLRFNVGYQFGSQTAPKKANSIYTVNFSANTIYISAGVFNFF